MKLGDSVKSITNALGIPQCKGCKRRQKRLNKLGDDMAAFFGRSKPKAQAKCEHCGKDCGKRLAVNINDRVAMVGTGCAKNLKPAKRKDLSSSYSTNTLPKLIGYKGENESSSNNSAAEKHSIPNLIAIWFSGNFMEKFKGREALLNDTSLALKEITDLGYLKNTSKGDLFRLIFIKEDHINKKGNKFQTSDKKLQSWTRSLSKAKEFFISIYMKKNYKKTASKIKSGWIPFIVSSDIKYRFGSTEDIILACKKILKDKSIKFSNKSRLGLKSEWEKLIHQLNTLKDQEEVLCFLPNKSANINMNWQLLSNPKEFISEIEKK